MSSRFDRRDNLERLFDQIEDADDQTLRGVLSHGGPDEVSVVLGLFSLERARRVLTGIPQERLAAAASVLRDGAKPPERAAERLATALRRATPPPAKAQTSSSCGPFTA